MGDEKLRKLGSGFYVDSNRSLYFKVREFLATHNLADTPEVRNAIWEQIRHDFGAIDVTELPDD